MSVSKSTLHDFIATVPSCGHHTNLATVVEIFSQAQSDCLVVVNQQQCPLGVLSLQRLMPQLLGGNATKLEPQQTPEPAILDLVEPLVAVSADLSVTQFGLYLRSPNATVSGNWALVDAAGKFLGLLDSSRLLKSLAVSATAIAAETPEPSSADLPLPNEYSVAPGVINSLAQLLERLPWPLVMQTSTGEVIVQNPAWWQQFGGWGDPEAIRQEVETVLATPKPATEPTQASEPRINSYHQLELAKQSVISRVEADIPRRHNSELSPEAGSIASAASRCQLTIQPGTCVCVWPMPNGQERVWQFVKIPLQHLASSELPTSQLPSSFALPNSSLWLLWAQDVTEQQQLESELVAKNADLIQLNRLKDEFLACISHELRTPLTAVLGLSTLLKDQALGQLNERQARYARLIHENGRHLMTVVNDILDLTRMETGQMELAPEPVKIAIVCDRAIAQAKAIAPKPAGESSPEAADEQQFTLAIEPGLETLVADELRLRQMLVHLLANAFKFTEAGGEIGLRVNYWEGWIAFTVWDTGIGIPEPKQHLIFQKFQQLENPLTRQFEGTGLGLVLTRALARMHGGDVSFISQAGKGSQFTLLLPPQPPKTSLSEEEARRRSSRESSSHATTGSPHHATAAKRLVLVVEAAPKFIEDLTEQLTGCGYWVVIARSGTEALEKARRLQPGVIFLNPLLPLLSGWDVLTLLKSDATTNQIPVIVTSTRAEKDKAFSQQADEFLNLPVQSSSLQQLLTRFNPEPAASSSQQLADDRVNLDLPLTVLRLLGRVTTPTQAAIAPESSLLNCRVLEADDLEQAELLARIWRPNVVLIDRTIANPLAYLQQLSQYSALAALPLVTLDPAITQAANQVQELSVFPCLTPTSELATETLLSVLQIAAGMNWERSVLVVDLATLSDLPEVKLHQPAKPAAFSSSSSGSEWFQALIQYLHTAGFRGLIAHSWSEVLQQIRQQSVDLLLLCLGELPLHPQAYRALQALAQQDHLPPVLVLNQRSSHSEKQQFHLEQPKADSSADAWTLAESGVRSNVSYSAEQLTTLTTSATAKPDTDNSLETVLAAIAGQILSPSLSMEELLDQIRQTIACPKRRVVSS